MEEERELVEAFSRELVYDFNIRRWIPYHRVVSRFTTPSVKLVYLLVAMIGPVSFTSIRRILSVSRRTVDKGLKELMDTGYIELDHLYMYSVNISMLDQKRFYGD